MEDGIIHRPNNIRHRTNFQCWIREEVRQNNFCNFTQCGNWQGMRRYAGLKCILSFPHTTTSVLCTKKRQHKIVLSQYSFSDRCCLKQLRKAVHSENQVSYSDSSNTLSLARQSLQNYPTSSFSRSLSPGKKLAEPLTVKLLSHLTANWWVFEYVQPSRAV